MTSWCKGHLLLLSSFRWNPQCKAPSGNRGQNWLTSGSNKDYCACNSVNWTFFVFNYLLIHLLLNHPFIPCEFYFKPFILFESSAIHYLPLIVKNLAPIYCPHKYKQMVRDYLTVHSDLGLLLQMNFISEFWNDFK